MFDVIKSDLDRLEDELIKAVAAPTDFVTEIGEYLITNGGKRIRPALFLLSAHGGEKFELGRLLPLAAALELIHTASLAHDDVIDEAALRRGVPTVNAKWGNQVSILGGDYIFAKAFKLVAEGGYGDYVSKRLAELVGNLSAGEIVQDKEAYVASKDFDGYYWRIEKKTADFLEICCELGAFSSGMDASSVSALARYGHHIGMAFQITDDLLDIMQPSEKTGKPAGSDIRQGVVTLPVIYALNESKHAAELAAIIADSAMTEEMALRALDIVRESGGVNFSQQKADACLKLAKESLPAGLADEVHEAFVLVADFIGERDF